MEKGRIIYLEVFSYLLLIIGTIGDHISTMIALRFPYLYEGNWFVSSLMSKGLWLPLDIILIFLGVTIPYLILRIKKGGPFRGLLAYPIVLGAIRLGACIRNLLLV